MINVQLISSLRRSAVLKAMLSKLVFAAILAFYHASSAQEKGVPNLILMVRGYMPCPFPYFPLPYGCWCGITFNPPSQGQTADEFDKLCKIHDYCYDSATRQGCSRWDMYFWLYKWDIVEGQIVCRENQPKCQKLICDCDKRVVEGLAFQSTISGCPRRSPGCPNR